MMMLQKNVALQKSAVRSSVKPAGLPKFSRTPRGLTIRAANEDKKPAQVVQPLNGDPFVGMLETPVTSAPIVANYLSNLPAYRTGVAPNLRGVEIGLAHGFLLAGPFIKLGPLRDVPGTAEVVGCMSAAGLVLILALCLSLYGNAAFQNQPTMGKKTLSGRPLAQDPLMSEEGWAKFAAGFTVGGLSGVAWAYILTQILPYYS